MQDRKNIILNGGEVTVAIEGRYTNLRIWKGNHGGNSIHINNIFFRLDKYKEYSVPLTVDNVRLDKPHEAVNILATKYGFKNATIDDLDDILDIIKNMKSRELLPW